MNDEKQYRGMRVGDVIQLNLASYVRTCGTRVDRGPLIIRVICVRSHDVVARKINDDEIYIGGSDDIVNLTRLNDELIEV